MANCQRRCLKPRVHPQFAEHSLDVGAYRGLRNTQLGRHGRSIKPFNHEVEAVTLPAAEMAPQPMRVVPLSQPPPVHYRGDVHDDLATPYSADGPDDGRESPGLMQVSDRSGLQRTEHSVGTSVSAERQYLR